MKIGTILFTYHRSRHTERVLHALSENSVLPEKLYIFQDGMKAGTNVSEWEKTGRIIRSFDWCKTEIHIADENKGLAKSITSGLDFVMGECDAVIVLEDDCIPDRHFMKFMKEALEAYQDEELVYSVSGYAWDICLPEDGYDAYFTGRASSFGWGTWRNRWAQYEEDYNILRRIKNNPDAMKRLNIWGHDLEPMLEARLTGKNDSWAVFWALKMIEKGGYCLNPSRQLIHNIGFDGSGENCGVMLDRFKESESSWDGMFRFPSNINSTQECEEEFQFLYAGKYGVERLKSYQEFLIRWLQMKQIGKSVRIPEERKKNLAVWGKGVMLDLILQEMQLSIDCIIETRPSLETYKEIPIVSVYELPKNIKNLIVIPYFDILIIRRKVEKLRSDICVMGLDELLT